MTPPPDRLDIQLWSYQYAPEPTGIGPVSALLARQLAGRGHRVRVVAAHPWYPTGEWGMALRPYRETREGIDVLRLPLWIGRDSSAQRIRQELSFTVAKLLALPALGRPDVVVAASPSFPALLPAVVYGRLRRVPWVLWLHDLLPEGATATGLVEPGRLLQAARRLEAAAYREARRIVVLSDAFVANLVAKGVPREKIERIYDPATRAPATDGSVRGGGEQPPRILSMGNIGLSQGLAPLVAAFERSPELAAADVRLVITGTGVAAEEVRREARSDRVEMLGLVDGDRLADELGRATIALVSQRHEGGEFNIPSKIMNFMAHGLPVLAAVNPRSEVARIVEASGGGWVADSGVPDELSRTAVRMLADPGELARRGAAARRFASEHFSPDGFGARFESVLREVVAGQPAGVSRPAPSATRS